jgi:energy-coupling factor transport system ATP-binding protein
MKRSQKILLAGYLALGFLALRIVYGFLFSGLWGTNIIFSIPELRLSGPFSHITLFGDVSGDGILRNLELAMPFALTILIFGIAGAFVTSNTLVRAANRAGRFRNLLVAIGISLSALPALFDAGQKVFGAIKLRSEKRSRLLVPILERSLELANSMGLKLALEPTGQLEPKYLKVRGLLIPDIGLGPIDFELQPRQVMVLSGATGSGKSSLLEAVAGISSEYQNRKIHGSFDFGLEESNPSVSEIAGFLRYIPQNPRELLWGFEASELISRLPEHLVHSLGLAGLITQSTKDLSEGEALKLLLAENLALNPKLLLLDEPYAPLDSNSRVQLTQILNELSESGISILVVEHDPEHTAGLAAEHFHLANGQLLKGHHQPDSAGMSRHLPVVGNELVLKANLKEIGFGTLLLRASKLELRQGECVWLSGDNGSGKSTLLRTLAKGEGVKIAGQDSVVGLRLVPENFDDFFVTESLGTELERADKVSKVPLGFTQTTLASILPESDLENWLSIHPRDLSRGTRLSLAIAMQLSHKPLALLIDEPFRGLDGRAKIAMVESLRCVLETGCAILFASHETSWSESIAVRGLVIKDQTLQEQSEVRA